MTLQNKILVIIGATILGLVLLSYAAAHGVLGGEFAVPDLGQISLNFFITLQLLSGLLVIVVIYLLIERLVLLRLIRFNHNTKKNRAGGDLASRVALTGGDELSRLKEVINEILNDQEQANNELQGGKGLYCELGERLRTIYQQLSAIIEFLPDATFVIDQDRKVSVWNRAMEEFTGVTKQKVIEQGDYAYALPFYGGQRPLLINLIGADISEMKELGYEQLERRGDTLYAETFAPFLRQGKGAFLGVTASALYDSKGNIVGAIETIRDITKQKKAQEQLEYLSLHDSLTGLYNRTYFEQEMDYLARGSYASIGIILCDVDDLKGVNDTMGHAMGDKVLLAVAGIFRDTLRSSDMVARIGGDEFAVLLPNCSKGAVAITCDRIREAVDKHNAGEPELPVNISIGYAVCCDKATNVTELFREADENMYRNKLERNQKLQIFQSGSVAKWPGTRLN